MVVEVENVRLGTGATSLSYRRPFSQLRAHTMFTFFAPMLVLKLPSGIRVVQDGTYH